MARILVAEDEENINRLVCKNLSLVGHTPLAALDGNAAIDLAKRESPDLVLLDVMLPGKDGFAVKQALPENLPVIFVTAKTALSDRLRGLGLGADDYIVKPFEMLELLARVQAVLRRTGKNASRFVYRDVEVDFSARRAYRAGQEVLLTPQEYSLIEALILNRNLALSREQLLQTAWGYSYAGESRTVDNHIQHLRKKLGLENEIQTVYKLGYRLTIQE